MFLRRFRVRDFVVRLGGTTVKTIPVSRRMVAKMTDLIREGRLMVALRHVRGETGCDIYEALEIADTVRDSM